MLGLGTLWTGVKTVFSGVTGAFDGIMDGWGGFADFAWPWLPIVGIVGGGLALGGLGGMAAGGLAGLGVMVVGGAAVGLVNGVWRGASDAVATATASDAPEVQPEGEEVMAQVTPDARDKDKSRAVG